MFQENNRAIDCTETMNANSFYGNGRTNTQQSRYNSSAKVLRTQNIRFRCYYEANGPYHHLL